MTIQFDEVARVLALIASDPAQSARMRLAYPEIGEACATIFKEPPKPFTADPCPDWSTISTIQLTVYDNHLLKKEGNRWGVGLKVYQGQTVDFNEPTWKGQAFMWPKKRIKDELRQICRTRNTHPFPEHGRDEFTQIVENFDYDFWGILKIKEPQGPSFHFVSHYVGMNVKENRVVEAALFMPGMEVPHVITAFDAKSASGGKLTGRAVAQSRESTSPELHGWVYSIRANRGAFI